MSIASDDDDRADSPLEVWIRVRGEDPRMRITRMRRQAQTYARGRGVPYADCEDIAQEALIILDVKWADPQERDKYGDVPEKALHGIAVNLVKRFFERRRATVSMDGVREAAKPVLPMRSRSNRERCLERHLDTLGLRARQMLTAYYHDDADRNEVARVAGVSYATLRVQVVRLKARLQDRITRCLEACERLRRRRPSPDAAWDKA
jgi:DNA-directed RNA polymerase specialized sigma24 family protein